MKGRGAREWNTPQTYFSEGTRLIVQPSGRSDLIVTLTNNRAPFTPKPLRTRSRHCANARRGPVQKHETFIEFSGFT
jgi:hypothetical protein